MTKTKEYVRMWCHKDFKKMLKINSAEEGSNIIDYTKKIAENKDREDIKRKFRFNI